MWLNLSSASFVSEDKYIVSSGGHTNYVSRGGIAILIKNSLLFIVVRDGKNGLQWKRDDIIVPRDTWFQLGITWSYQDGLTVFINGLQNATSGSVSYTAGDTYDATGVFMHIGKPNTVTSNFGMFYIDEWYFWDSALTSEHLLDIYEYYKPGIS